MAVNYQQKHGVYPTLVTSDPDSRDPNEINKHLRLDFFNVIAEPDQSAHSFEILHSAFNGVYQYSKLFIYRFLTIFLGIPLMLFWGLTFGVYTFLMIWFAVPARRLMQSAIAESGFYVQTICDAVISPVYRSLGQMFSSIRVTLSNQTNNSARTIEI